MIVANGYRIFQPLPRRNESNAQDLHTDTFEPLCHLGFRFQTPLNVQIFDAALRSYAFDRIGGPRPYNGLTTVLSSQPIASNAAPAASRTLNHSAQS